MLSARNVYGRLIIMAALSLASTPAMINGLKSTAAAAAADLARFLFVGLARGPTEWLPIG